MYEKELYVIVQDLKKWRHYIFGNKMVILTDHKPLQFALTRSKLQTTWQLKWINYLQQFQLVIKYRKGKSSSAADCLTRPPISLLSTVMSMQGYDTTNWPQLYLIDCDFSTIYRQLQTDKLSTAYYFLKDTFLYKLRQLCVLTGEHRQEIIWDAQYNKTEGHFGVSKTLVILQKYFYWPSLNLTSTSTFNRA